eukprot:scaffold1175_cov248-Pinguiococcus_pyrenoidosus.AAC.8
MSDDDETSWESLFCTEDGEQTECAFASSMPAAEGRDGRAEAPSKADEDPRNTQPREPCRLLDTKL